MRLGRVDSFLSKLQVHDRTGFNRTYSVYLTRFEIKYQIMKTHHHIPQKLSHYRNFAGLTWYVFVRMILRVPHLLTLIS